VSDYGLDDLGSIPNRGRGFFSSSPCVQTGSDLITISLLWLCITLCPPIFFTPLPSPCVLFTLNRNNRENYRPNYKWANVIEMELNTRCCLSNSTQDTELRLPPTLCSGGNATAHLKAIAHVPPNKLYRGYFPRGKARPGRDDDHSPPSSAKVKYEKELYLVSPMRLHGMQQDSFTFTRYKTRICLRGGSEMLGVSHISETVWLNFLVSCNCCLLQSLARLRISVP
jgi:hypothetical protein